MVLLKKDRGTMVGCGWLELWSMVIRNKAAARRVSLANELVQSIANWEIKKTKVMKNFGDKNTSDDRHTVLWGHTILKHGTLK